MLSASNKCTLTQTKNCYSNKEYYMFKYLFFIDFKQNPSQTTVEAGFLTERKAETSARN